VVILHLPLIKILHRSVIKPQEHLMLH
jgi:hypothetical protein